MQGLIRIYEDISLNNEIEIKDSNFHYLKNVRRLSEGDKIVILNSEKIGLYKIEQFQKKKFLAICQEIKSLVKPKYALVVYQCVLKRDFMDNVLEKLGEIGVTKVVPITSQRSIGSVKPSTMNRYRQLVRAGALQAEHDYIPEVAEPVTVGNIDNTSDSFYIFYERLQGKNLPVITKNNISIFIGPEGGITDEEIDILKEKGGEIISPISSVLKAETASVIFAGLIKCMMESSCDI